MIIRADIWSRKRANSLYRLNALLEEVSEGFNPRLELKELMPTFNAGGSLTAAWTKEWYTLSGENATAMESKALSVSAQQPVVKTGQLQVKLFWQPVSKLLDGLPDESYLG